MLAGTTICSLAWHFHSQPRAWAVEEVPVAFWAWRTQAPTEAEVEAAARQARARTIFLRAGQLDCEAGRLRRIRAAAGRFPRAIDLHLVYHATRSVLTEFERLDEAALAATFGET